MFPTKKSCQDLSLKKSAKRFSYHSYAMARSRRIFARKQTRYWDREWISHTYIGTRIYMYMDVQLDFTPRFAPMSPSLPLSLLSPPLSPLLRWAALPRRHHSAAHVAEAYGLAASSVPNSWRLPQVLTTAVAALAGEGGWAAAPLATGEGWKQKKGREGDNTNSKAQMHDTTWIIHSCDLSCDLSFMYSKCGNFHLFFFA